jgi:hypothetical protein
MSEDLDELIALARELPVDVPDAAHREEVRTSLLARAQLHRAPPRTRRYATFLPFAVVAAGALWLVRPAPSLVPMVLPALPDFPHRGHVDPHAGAAFELASAVPDERVVLHDGTIEVHVDRLHAPERFRVLIGASEVEVRGTAFTVTADHDRLLEVRVTHGRVEVRPADRAQITLAAGDRWTATPSESPPPSPPPAPRAVVHRPAPPRVATADQLAYDDAWTALRTQRFAEAAAAFARTLADAPTGALAEDARFWHAVALARAHHDAAAITAFREAIDEHPGSSHAAEASAMLGWLLVDAKQLAEARERFAAAADDANDRVRSSARAGLEALARAGH